MIEIDPATLPDGVRDVEVGDVWVTALIRSSQVFGCEAERHGEAGPFPVATHLQAFVNGGRVVHWYLTCADCTVAMQAAV